METWNDQYFMRLAIVEAEKAAETGEIPVGAVIVSGNQVIAKGYNLTERLTDVTAHAEIQAITAASNFLGAKYLKDCTLYVTLEPCPMCAGALYWSQISKVVFAAEDQHRGAGLYRPSLFHPSTQLVSGIESERCAHLLKSFFQAKR